MRTFIYCRVSTTEQTTTNQVLAIKNKGYDGVPKTRIVEEDCSGSTPAASRKGFSKLVDKLEEGDRLIVLKVDRLGRDAIDVLSTVERLTKMGVTVISLDLPNPDLSTPEGKLMLGFFSVFAEWERNKIKERTLDGLTRARSEGKKLGRPEAIETSKRVKLCRTQGMTQSQTVTHTGLSLATVKRHWNK